MTKSTYQYIILVTNTITSTYPLNSGRNTSQVVITYIDKVVLRKEKVKIHII